MEDTSEHRPRIYRPSRKRIAAAMKLYERRTPLLPAWAFMLLEFEDMRGAMEEEYDAQGWS